jgi:pimeloyl-ACP methyl ester carboxylesterase
LRRDRDGSRRDGARVDRRHRRGAWGPDALPDTFLQDCSPEIAVEAGAHLARQSLSVLQQPVTASAWRQIPSTYLVCTRDRGTPVAAQREFARRATHVVELDAGHHPFLSQPAAVAGLITGLS